MGGGKGRRGSPEGRFTGVGRSGTRGRPVGMLREEEGPQKVGLLESEGRIRFRPVGMLREEEGPQKVGLL